MTNTASLSPFTGGVGHLKLHAPTERTPCPFRSSAVAEFVRFHALNTAFQQATGWELRFQETESSYRHRLRLGNPDFPAIGKMAIWDLSRLLPPGIPAVSRIYCEKLVEELNGVVAELGRCRQEAYRSAGVSSDRASAEVAGRSPGNRPPIEPLQDNLPLESHSFTLIPTISNPGKAACDWHVDSSGNVRFLIIHCSNPTGTSTGELIAARSAFQAECRHGSGNVRAREAIQGTIERFFGEPLNLMTMVGSFQRLTGDIKIAGAHDFIVGSTMPKDLPRGGLSGEVSFHLSAGHHLLMNGWEEQWNEDEYQEWSMSTLRIMRETAPDQLAGLVETQMECSIPSLPAKPVAGLVISRH